MHNNDDRATRSASRADDQDRVIDQVLTTHLLSCLSVESGDLLAYSLVLLPIVIAISPSRFSRSMIALFLSIRTFPVRTFFLLYCPFTIIVEKGQTVSHVLPDLLSTVKTGQRMQKV